MKPATLLIIEDDDFQYEIYADVLSNYRLVRALNGTQALQEIPRARPDVVILDHVLADGELGLSFLPELKELLPFVPIIVVSGALEVHQQIHALQGPRRAHYCLTKPVDVHDLRRVVQTAISECGESETFRQFEALERARRVDAEELFTRSTDRLTRQARIRDRLTKNPQRPNISALSREFSVARRTILRDLHELIRRGEIPPELYAQLDADKGDSDQPL